MKLNFYSGRHLRRGNTWSPRSQVTNQVRPNSHDDHLGPRGLSICCSFHFFLLLLPSSFNALKLAHYSLLYFQILFFFFFKKNQKFRSFSGSQNSAKNRQRRVHFFKNSNFFVVFFYKIKIVERILQKIGSDALAGRQLARSLRPSAAGCSNIFLCDPHPPGRVHHLQFSIN